MKLFNKVYKVTVLLLLLFLSVSANCQEKSQKIRVYLFEIKEEIAPPALLNVQKAIRESREFNADLILLHLNTYGGLLETADSIRTAILNSSIPFWVFIDNNAASAGALISIACDSIYMRKGGSIGAATVVTQTAEPLPDKYQSYMRSMMRATAEAKNRDPDIAQAMVDPDIYVPGVSDSGKVLTFTASEAVKHGFCEAMVETIDDIFSHNNITNYEIIKQELTALDKITRFLTKPVISGLLIMIIIGGIYFELQTPGVGFPLLAALIAAMLYFAPLYMEGLASHWEILAFVAGVVLLAVEIFVLPGFGVAGISGIVLVLVSLTFSMVESDGFKLPEGNYTALASAFGIVVASVFLGLVISIYVAQKTISSSLFSHLILADSQESSQGYTSSDNKLRNFIGQEAIAATILRPSGKIVIGDDYYDATAEAGYIEKGASVKITRYESMQLFVRPVNYTESSQVSEKG